jgi:hypothetical protein
MMNLVELREDAILERLVWSMRIGTFEVLEELSKRLKVQV